MKTLKFSSNDSMPALGLGTWKSPKGEVYRAVKTAIKLGYRHLDCAPVYGNQHEVGTAIKECIEEGLVTREELWITSKLWNDAHAEADVIPALQETLKSLQLNYLDLFLIHWPVALKKGIGLPQRGDDFIALSTLPLSTTWKGMERAKDQHLARHIGVSNFGIESLKKILAEANHPPEMNQVECHPYLPQNELHHFCREHAIHLTAYAPLGSGDRSAAMKAEDEPDLLGNPLLNNMARAHDLSVAQVILGWDLQRGMAVIPKSTNPQRMAENLAATKVSLSEADMNHVASLAKNYRYVNGRFWLLEGVPYTYEGLWE